MTGSLRSKQGCWTCRLRKKKCDERFPQCSTCELLSITCYGFGPKPEWMDSGERGRVIANSLKEIVKHTSRRKPAAQLPNQRYPIIDIAPKSSNISTENSSSAHVPNHQQVITPQTDYESSEVDGVDKLQNGSVDISFNEKLLTSICSIPADESVLLMNFLDNVFKLQYPLYNPGIRQGGRGWLFTLLLRTRPLYHGALALSAYHRRMTTHAKTSRPCQVDALIQQEKHLELSIKSVNLFSQHSCARKGLGITTGVIQLMFFELFTGSSDAWQPHLRAALNMFHEGYKDNIAYFGLSEKSRTILSEDLPPPEFQPGIEEEIVSFRFLVGTMIWLDITSSITMGMAPYLPRHNPGIISSNSQIRLEDIVGCRNWAMLQIGRISALHQGKTQTLRPEQFDDAEFEQTVNDISKELQSGLTRVHLEPFNPSEFDSVTPCNTIPDPSALITRLFAYVAFIYLHLIIRGFQDLEVLDTKLVEAMTLLQSQIPTRLRTAIVSPLFIIGSIAREGDELFFRIIFNSPPLQDPVLKHRERILPILEEIWSRRRTTPSFGWREILELTSNVLLL